MSACYTIPTGHNPLGFVMPEAHRRRLVGLASRYGVPIIEDDVRIGSDTMLVAPVTVGKGSVTAAGSVVIENVPPNTLVAGVPAKVKKKLTEAGK